MFVWNLEEGRVTEQMVVTIPATPGNIFPGLNVQSKYGKFEKYVKGANSNSSFLGVQQSLSWKIFSMDTTPTNKNEVIENHLESDIAILIGC